MKDSNTRCYNFKKKFKIDEEEASAKITSSNSSSLQSLSILVELHNDMLDSLFGSSESLRLLKVLEVELLLDFLLNALGLPSITLEREFKNFTFLCFISKTDYTSSLLSNYSNK